LTSLFEVKEQQKYVSAKNKIQEKRNGHQKEQKLPFQARNLPF
jgi:hypothetical protein